MPKGCLRGGTQDAVVSVFWYVLDQMWSGWRCGAAFTRGDGCSVEYYIFGEHVIGILDRRSMKTCR
jgi:hypothetical protein